MQKPSKEQIKQLLKSGFDYKLISFEFRIPIEEIELIKKELEQTNFVKDKNTKRKLISKKREVSSHEKFMIMRDRYKKLYFDVVHTEEDSERKSEITPEERRKVDEAMTKIQEILESMNGELTEKQERSKAFAILKEIRGISNYQLSIEQAEQLISVLQSSRINNLKLTDYNHKIQYSTSYGKGKAIVSRKYIQAIDMVQSETTDIEKLKILKKKLNSNPLRDYYSAISVGVKSKINLKIEKDSNQTILNKIKNDISENILEIVRELSEGTLDIESANEIINEEAKRRVQSKVKNKFSLTEEQERNQILFQIRTALEERTEQYRITNPEMTIYQLHNLCGDSLNQSVSSVINNLINSKTFERAKKVYAKFENESQTDEYSYSMESIRKKIRNAEIGDMVLRGIRENGNAKQDANYFELIEKGLRTANVKKRNISLGKSQSGLRNITLDDVWPDKEREK